MANVIGKFTQTETGFVGRVKTLEINLAVEFVVIEHPVANGPRFRVMAGDVEIGKAWEKVGKQNGTIYHQVTMDDPSFAAPLYANLYQGEEGGHDLVWQRNK